MKDFFRERWPMLAGYGIWLYFLLKILAVAIYW